MEESGYEIFSSFYDALTENVEYPRRATRFHEIIQEHCSSQGKVLVDLACGTGSMSEEMSKLGYDVLGIDYSQGMLQMAWEKKMESGLPIQYICQDMRELELYGTADVVICTLDSLNHLDNFTDVSKVFQEVYNTLEQGGVFVFDMNTCFKHRAVLGNQTYTYETEDVYCVWENSYTQENNRVDITLNFFVQDEEEEIYHRYIEEIHECAYPSEQVRGALEKIGFKVCNLYGTDMVSPLQEESDERMLFVAKKE